MNFHTPRQLVSAHHFDAEDKYWALCEDPSMFLGAIASILDRLSSKSGEQPHFASAQNIFAIPKFLEDTYSDIIIWYKLRHLTEKFTSDIIISPQSTSRRAFIRLLPILHALIPPNRRGTSAGEEQQAPKECSSNSIAPDEKWVDLYLNMLDDSECHTRSAFNNRNESAIGKLFLVLELARQMRLHEPRMWQLYREHEYKEEVMAVPSPLDTIHDASEIHGNICDLIDSPAAKFMYPTHHLTNDAKLERWIASEQSETANF
ncbi:hypothetical protein F5Y04DRAFT_287188 [Hypomontagnella monticulosa]|nr:hypothetical protein F5Y04DRAFT_287188 [Hypomontagnella monticulosa]